MANPYVMQGKSITMQIAMAAAQNRLLTSEVA